MSEHALSAENDASPTDVIGEFELKAFLSFPDYVAGSELKMGYDAVLPSGRRQRRTWTFGYRLLENGTVVPTLTTKRGSSYDMYMLDGEVRHWSAEAGWETIGQKGEPPDLNRNDDGADVAMKAGLREMMRFMDSPGRDAFFSVGDPAPAVAG